MAPEYGATCGIFPIDGESLNYLRLSGREEEHIRLVEAGLDLRGVQTMRAYAAAGRKPSRSGTSPAGEPVPAGDAGFMWRKGLGK